VVGFKKIELSENRLDSLQAFYFVRINYGGVWTIELNFNALYKFE
jgi:hypothetical protein